LRADRASIEAPEELPVQRNRKVLHLPVDGGVLVLRREYRFLDAEVQRAAHVLLACERAAAIGRTATRGAGPAAD
jgi:hypothetical protein